VNVISVTVYIADRKIRIQKLCLNLYQWSQCLYVAGIVDCCTVSAVVCAWWR